MYKREWIFEIVFFKKKKILKFKFPAKFSNDRKSKFVKVSSKETNIKWNNIRKRLDGVLKKQIFCIEKLVPGLPSKGF